MTGYESGLGLSRNHMSNREWSTWKRRLTIATKKKPSDVITVCDAFFAREDDVCLPDDWARFERARDDAKLALQRQGRTAFWR